MKALCQDETRHMGLYLKWIGRFNMWAGMPKIVRHYSMARSEIGPFFFWLV